MKNKRIFRGLLLGMVLLLLLAGCGGQKQEPLLSLSQATVPMPDPAPTPGGAAPRSAADAFEIGDVVLFGCYPKRGDPIEWVVIDKYDGNLLLLSVYGLDSRPFHNSDSYTTWETSDLRHWLCHSFFDEAFTRNEKRIIVDYYAPADRNPYFDTHQGNDTLDVVTLLSGREAERYFSGDWGRVCYPNQNAKNHGAYSSPENNGGWWWLRTMGEGNWDAASVNTDGSMDYDDGSVNSPKGMVRPMVLVKP